MAAAGGNGDSDACCLRGAQGPGRPVADLLRKGGQKGSIHVDRHQANRKVHVLSLRAGVERRERAKDAAALLGRDDAAERVTARQDDAAMIDFRPGCGGACEGGIDGAIGQGSAASGAPVSLVVRSENGMALGADALHWFEYSQPGSSDESPNSRFPAGMTERKAKAKTGSSLRSE